MNTKQIIDEMEKELLQYSSGGYSGGKDGLRCFECDRKYSGEASYGQLCAVCNFHSYTRKLIEALGEENKNKGLNYLSKELRKEVKELNKSLIQKMIDPIAHARKMDTIRFVQQRIPVAKLIEKEQRLKVKEIITNLK